MPKARRQRASTLVMVMLVIAVTATMIGAAISWSMNTNYVAQRATQLTIGNMAVDSYMETMFSRWRDILSYDPNTEHSAAELAGGVDIVQPTGKHNISVTDPLDDNTLKSFAAANVTFDVPTIVHVSQEGDGGTTVSGKIDPLPTVPEPMTPKYSLYYQSTKPGYTGYKAYNVVYAVTSTASVTWRGGASNAVKVGVKRYFTKVISPLFANAVFFQDDLELHNSGTTIIDGLVHTNANMYACSFDPGRLSFLGNVSYVGDFNGPDGTTYLSDAAQSRFQGNSTSAPHWDGAGQINQLKQVDRMNVGGLDPSEFDTTDTNHNNDSLREIIEIPYKNNPQAALDDDSNKNPAGGADPPDVASQRIYNQAPLRILIDGDNITVRDWQDHVINDPSFLADLNAAIPQAQRTRPLLDRREDPNVSDDQAVSVSTLDLNLFNQAIKNVTARGSAGPMAYATPANPHGWNGTLYIADITGSTASGAAESAPTHKRAVMLTNGAKLPGYDIDPNNPLNKDIIQDRNFTVATQNGLYIKGDYNTGSYTDLSGNYVQPASNYDNSASGVATEVPGYTSVPSAVMADAVTVVSRAFANADNSDPDNPIVEGNLDQPIQYVPGNPVRKAVATTINTAVVSGDVPSNYGSNGKPSGGAHNLTRFLENWDDPTTPGGSNKVLFTYNGSLVQLFVSKEFNGGWDTKNIYQNPQRLIRFDTRLLNAPPTSWPSTIAYQRGKWVRYNP